MAKTPPAPLPSHFSLAKQCKSNSIQSDSTISTKQNTGRRQSIAEAIKLDEWTKGKVEKNRPKRFHTIYIQRTGHHVLKSSTNLPCTAAKCVFDMPIFWHAAQAKPFISVHIFVFSCVNLVFSFFSHSFARALSGLSNVYELMADFMCGSWHCYCFLSSMMHYIAFVCVYCPATSLLFLGVKCAILFHSVFQYD